MLTDLAIIILLGMTLGGIFKACKMPPLVGMILTGMILGPYGADLLSDGTLELSAQLRQAALVIILMRAGLSLKLEDLKKVGRPALFLCFVPACFEMLGIVLLAPKLLGMTVLEAVIMGSVLAAVSPAVIVPRMIKLMENGYGVKKSIPQMILAGASVDDIFVIVIFTSFSGLASGKEMNAMSFLEIPASIFLGVLLGITVGYLMILFFQKVHIRDTIKILILLSVSFLYLECEKRLGQWVSVSGLLAVMTTGILLCQKKVVLAERLSIKYNKLWVGAEVLLFVLVGAAVDMRYALKAGGMIAIVLLLGLCFRALGVYISLMKTKLKGKEKIFCILAYMPKATVQAAIGSIPLSMGLACGNQVLTAAVLAILITAPIGAFCIDLLYGKCLEGGKE